MARKLFFEQQNNDDSNLNKITDFDGDNTEDDLIVKAKITLEESNFLLQKRSKLLYYSADTTLFQKISAFQHISSVSTWMFGMKV